MIFFSQFLNFKIWFQNFENKGLPGARPPFGVSAYSAAIGVIRLLLNGTIYNFPGAPFNSALYVLEGYRYLKHRYILLKIFSSYGQKRQTTTGNWKGRGGSEATFPYYFTTMKERNEVRLILIISRFLRFKASMEPILEKIKIPVRNGGFSKEFQRIGIPLFCCQILLFGTWESVGKIPEERHRILYFWRKPKKSSDPKESSALLPFSGGSSMAYCIYPILMSWHAYIPSNGPCVGDK